MLYYVIVSMSFSIWIAALAGLLRLRQTDTAYYPFIILCCTGAINELLSLLIARAGHSTNVNNNIYVLAEALLLLWQLHKWLPDMRMKRYSLPVLIALVLVWLYEYNSFADLQLIRYYFRFFYAVVIIGLSIQLMQWLIIEQGSGLGKDARFLIATGLTIYFTVKILFDAIWLFEFRRSVAFQHAIIVILACVNFLINLLYVLAILWMPRKLRYI